MNWAEIFDKIRAHANNSYPHECCGIVLNSGEVIQSDNVFDPPQMRNVRYKIDTLLLRRYDWEEVLGFYHSHLEGGAYAGMTDNADATYPGKLQIIAGMKDFAADEVRVYLCMCDFRGLRLVPNQPIDPMATAIVPVDANATSATVPQVQ